MGKRIDANVRTCTKHMGGDKLQSRGGAWGKYLQTRVRKPAQPKVPMENHHRSQQMGIHATVGLHTTAKSKRVELGQ